MCASTRLFMKAILNRVDMRNQKHNMLLIHLYFSIF